MLQIYAVTLPDQIPRKIQTTGIVAAFVCAPIQFKKEEAFHMEVHARVISHVASTLEGNSGGPVLDLTTMPGRAIGLQFGGGARKRNFALSVPAI